MKNPEIVGVVFVLLLLLSYGGLRGASGVVLNQTHIIVDNFGMVNLDDVNDRDRLRDEISKRMVLTANNFVAYLRTGAWREELERLVDPAQVATVPVSLVNAFENLEPIDFDGTWTEESQQRLDRIRVAMALKGLIDFGVPGKLAPYDEPGQLGHDGLDRFLDETSGADPAFLQRIREYEDQVQRLTVIRVQGTTGERAAAPLDVPGMVLDLMNEATTGIVNPPPQGLVHGFIDNVRELFVDPAASGWRVNPAWWDHTLASDDLKSAANSYELVSGAQLLGIKIDDLDPEYATADEIIETLSRAREYSLAYRGRTYAEAQGVSGLWTGGDELEYHLGSVDETGVETHEVRMLEWVGVRERRLQIMAADYTEIVSGLGTEVHEFPISEEILLMLKLIDAFHDPATNVPATEAGLVTEDPPGDPFEVFHGGGDLGSSF